MKLLVIVVADQMVPAYCNNIKILNDFLIQTENIQLDYCGISNQDDFINYESIIQFKYKVINSNRQLTKVCDFISQYKNELSYDWYIKIRPDIRLLEPIKFDILSETAINARARKYIGPKYIKNGMSVNGVGMWMNIGECFYSEKERQIELDDQMYIFHHNIVKQGAFNVINEYRKENETIHDEYWRSRGIHKNVIGLNIYLEKHNVYSGDLNPKK
jgi:hypothetical protein